MRRQLPWMSVHLVADPGNDIDRPLQRRSSKILPGRIVAADYRILLDGAVDAAAIERACARLMAAETLPRDRLKSGATVRYDLRPLLAEVGMVEPGPPVVVRARTRFHPELGTGRPDEVIGALAEAAGEPLQAASIVRERLILADEDPTG